VRENMTVTVLENKQCTTCGNKHDLYTDGLMEMSATGRISYEYVCPTTGSKVQF